MEKKRSPILRQADLVVKSIFIITGIYASLIVDLTKLLIIVTVTILLFLSNTDILRFWLKTLIRVTPLFISLLLLGIILKIDYFAQLHLILKISFIILLSVFLVKSLDIKHKLLLLKTGDRKISDNIKLYFFATINYISVLLDYFNSTDLSNRNFSEVLSNSLELKDKGYSGKGPEFTDTDIKPSASERCRYQNLLLILLIILFILVIGVRI